VAARLIPAAALAALLLAGCGSSGTTIPQSKLSKLVLQQRDLPKGFASFYLGRQLAADQPGTRSDPERFGRLGGWIGRWHRAGSTATEGPLVVASRADLFKDSGGAKQELAADKEHLSRLAGSAVDPGKLGDAAVAYTFVQRGAVDVRSYSIAWRQANAEAELDLNGFDGKLSLADALALARKQQARLIAASR